MHFFNGTNRDVQEAVLWFASRFISSVFANRPSRGFLDPGRNVLVLLLKRSDLNAAYQAGNTLWVTGRCEY